MTLKSFSVVCLVVLACSAAQAATIAPWVVENTKHGKTAEFFVILKQQADLYPATTLTTKLDRGRFVYATLYQQAQLSQAPLRQWLDAKGVSYRPYYIVNALLVTGNRALVKELAARDDVERIEGNPVIHNDLPQPEPAADTPNAIEPNITKVRAPQMWGLGYTGQNVVVGGQDTGYRWTHNALKNKYRGWDGVTADHDYNWHDSIHSGGGVCGADSPEPCDDFFHGTHTMGTILGDDGGSNQIGMAPGAKWIGCRNMNQGAGTPATYLECFEFFLAPYPVGGTPAQGDPAMAPDVTSNSWGCPDSEGCSDLTLQSAVNAQKAAGIMTVVSAGNSGSACGTVDDPPAMYDASYTVGATNNSDQMASFSSRGPGDTTNLMKPNLVAPGVSVRSATNSGDAAYTTASGTSMAAPHVAGAVALFWSAITSMKNQQDNTEAQFNASVVRLPSIVESCGGDYVNGPNNTWGFGRLDILAAYQYACTPHNVTSFLNGSGQPVITWSAVPGATQYEVDRGNGACPGSAVSILGTTVFTSFTDTLVAQGLTYSYYVKAVSGSCASVLSACVDETIPCTFSIDPATASYNEAGGSGNVDVTTAAACGWTGVSNATWLHITAGTPGTGNGTVSYSVDANPDSTPRQGTLTVAGKTFTVDQSGAPCSYILTPSSANVAGAGGSFTATVTAPGGCAWDALSDSAWITFPNGSSGSGNGNLDYNVASNPDTTPRQGTITVEGQTLTIDQAAGCLFCDDFEDGILASNWDYAMPSWSETGGQLVGTPASRKALAVAAPAFAGCVNCSIHTALSTTGGIGGRAWVLGWYIDKKNSVQLLMKEANDKWLLKQVSGGQVVAKTKFAAPIDPGTTYVVDLSFDGTSIHVSIDGVERMLLAPGAPMSVGTVGFQVRSTTAAFDEIAVN